MTFSSQSGWGLTLRTVMSTSYRSVSLSVLFYCVEAWPLQQLYGFGKILLENHNQSNCSSVFSHFTHFGVSLRKNHIVLKWRYVNNILLQIFPSLSLSVPLLLKTKPLKNLNKIIVGHPYSKISDFFKCYV